MRAAPIDSVAELEGAATYELALGMRHLGTNGLLESILLKETVDFRLRAFEERAGVVTRDVRAAEGQRLYGAVFYLELQAPADVPLSCYRENDVLRLVDHSRMSGRSMLDGYVFFDSPSTAWGRLPARIATSDLRNAPFGWIRVGQRFVHDEQGISQLRLAEPANVDRARVGSWSDPSSAAEAHRRILRTRPTLPPECRALCRRPVVAKFPIDPEQAVNGAGLFYFPAYVTMIDMAERRLLQRSIWPPCPDALIGARAPMRRTICYYGNAGWNDRAIVEVRSGVADRRPARARTASGALVGAALSTVAQVFRESDAALIAVAESEKLLVFDRLVPTIEAALDDLLGAEPRA